MKNAAISILTFAFTSAALVLVLFAFLQMISTGNPLWLVFVLPFAVVLAA